jgi:two-component sensor histidine kinase
MKLSLYFLIVSFPVVWVISAEAQTLYEHPADEYYKKALNFNSTHRWDSAYYYAHLSYKAYNKVADSLNMANAKYVSAMINYKARNYPGSENECTDALGLLSGTPHDKLQYYLYVLIGLNALEKNSLSVAYDYFNKAGVLSRSIRKKKFYRIYYNNMGLLEEKRGNYARALMYYDSVLSLYGKSIKPHIYSRTVKNKAWIYYLNEQYTQVYPLLIKGLQIDDSLSHKEGQALAHLRLAYYFRDTKQPEKTLIHAQKAYQLNNDLHLFRDVNKSLTLLSEIDPTSATRYFERYRLINDSLMKVERKFKEQAARIRYETKEKERKIEEQKRELTARLYKFIAILSLLVISIAFVMILLHQKGLLRKKNRQIQDQLSLITELKKEVHHKTKNDLMRVRSLLSEQKNNIPEESFHKLHTQLEAFILLHKLLYQGKTGDKTSVQEFFTMLCDIFSSVYSRKSKCQVKSDLELGYDLLKNLALILNEAITNIYKHAYDNVDDTVEIRVNMLEENGRYHLEILDKGRGTIQPDNEGAFGLSFIKNLVENEWQGDIIFSNTGDKHGILINFPKHTT